MPDKDPLPEANACILRIFADEEEFYCRDCGGRCDDGSLVWPSKTFYTCKEGDSCSIVSVRCPECQKKFKEREENE